MGSNNLKVLLHALKRALEPDLPHGRASRFMRFQDGCYSFQLPPGTFLDVAEFEERLRLGKALEQAGDGAAALQWYQRAADLYTGDYLADAPYDDWCAAEKERLLELYLELLQSMARLEAQCGRWEDCIAHCRVALVKDPCREHIHRDLMRYLWAAGRRSEALQAYQRCHRILADELGVEPLPETSLLYRAILEHATSESVEADALLSVLPT